MAEWGSRIRRAAALLALLAGAAGWQVAPEAGTRQPAVMAAPAVNLTASVSEAAAVVTAAERALTERKLEALNEPFGGLVPAWARDWVTRRGKHDLFDRQWHGHAVRLPASYHGAEWLAVFSMYHPVESDADHFHRLEQRNGAWSVGTEIGEREP